MRFPWQKRHDRAAAETEQAKNQYEWAVQNRTTVQALVAKIKYHGERNGIIEMIHLVAKGRS